MKYTVESSRRDLQDLQTFASLRDQISAKFRRKFSHVCIFIFKMSLIFPKLVTNLNYFGENSPEFQQVLRKMKKQLL